MPNMTAISSGLIQAVCTHSAAVGRNRDTADKARTMTAMSCPMIALMDSIFFIVIT